MTYGKYSRVVVTKMDGTTIPEDEPVFVLRAQDILAPIAVNFYADLLEATTGNHQEGERARNFALLMANWSPRKVPD